MSISPWITGGKEESQTQHVLLCDPDDGSSSVTLPPHHMKTKLPIKFRVINLLQYEPQLGAYEDRVTDIIQIYPKDGVFDPPAQIRIDLPAFASSPQIGQLVCIYCRTYGSRSGSTPKWKPLCSEDFTVNDERTEATILCRKSGLFTIKRTDFPEVTKQIVPSEECTLSLPEVPGIEARFPVGCVTKPQCVSLKVIYNEKIFSDTGGRTPRKKSRIDGEFIDTSASPVVVLMPTNGRLVKPAMLKLSVIGSEFNDVFEQANGRMTAVHGCYHTQEGVKWNYVFSIPQEIMVLMTDIEEPGKQFRLKIMCHDSPINSYSDNTYKSEVSRAHLSVPLGRVRFVVRGKFEADRDAPERSPDRTVVFTGKRFCVEYRLKLMLNDLTKLPDVFGHVSIFGRAKVQYQMALKKPDMHGRSRLSMVPAVYNTTTKRSSRGLVTTGETTTTSPFGMSSMASSQHTETHSPHSHRIHGTQSSSSVLPHLHSTDSSTISSPQRLYRDNQSVTTLPEIRIT